MMSSLMDLTQNALILVLILSLPSIVAASLVGLFVSLIQALTQIQEQTLSFAIKLIAVIATIIFTARWLGSEVFTYSLQIFDLLPVLGR